MDKMILSRMQFFAYHGVFPEENKLGQRYFVDVELWLPLREAGTTDDIDKTINYAHVYATIQDIVEKKTFKLVETIAAQVATALLHTYTIINEITVRVTKPHPPVPALFDGMTVEIHRKRA